jgi:hypothetical protein
MLQAVAPFDVLEVERESIVAIWTRFQRHASRAYVRQWPHTARPLQRAPGDAEITVMMIKVRDFSAILRTETRRQFRGGCAQADAATPTATSAT